MSEASVPQMFAVNLDQPPASKFERERRAFLRLLPKLLEKHLGQFVAIHNEQIVDAGANRLEVAMRVLNRIGNMDIFVGFVSDRSEPIARSGVRRSPASAGLVPAGRRLVR